MDNWDFFVHPNRDNIYLILLIFFVLNDEIIKEKEENNIKHIKEFNNNEYNFYFDNNDNGIDIRSDISSLLYESITINVTHINPSIAYYLFTRIL